MPTDEELMQSTPEDQEFWCNCVRGLPGLEGFSGTGKDKFGENIPWGTGPHSLKAFRETIDIVKPKSIFEIGFNNGYASAVFLELSKEGKVFSCDISVKDETIEGAMALCNKYPHRFKYTNRKEQAFLDEMEQSSFDLCFVDGGHLQEDVEADIRLCLVMDIPYLLFDDMEPRFSAAQEVINRFAQLGLVKRWPNIALYKNMAA